MKTLSQGGFSLLEALVTLVIVVLLSMAAFPSFIEMRDRNYVRSAAEQMLGRLAEARLDAMNRNEVITVAFDDLIEEFAAEDGVTLTDPTFGDIEIEPKLAMLVDTSSTGSVDIQRGNFTIRFGVSPIGQGFICNPSGGGVGYPACDE